MKTYYTCLSVEPVGKSQHDLDRIVTVRHREESGWWFWKTEDTHVQRYKGRHVWYTYPNGVEVTNIWLAEWLDTQIRKDEWTNEEYEKERQPLRELAETKL